MSRKRKWREEKLLEVVRHSHSIREVLLKLNLIPAGGNYAQIQKYILDEKIDTSHFVGQGWRKGRIIPTVPAHPIQDLLVIHSHVQSFKLKHRLFKEGLKKRRCELCGWARQALDGRIPLELDHRNGNRNDNRIENLRILCPNCHSLQPTHRSRNIKRKLLQ